MRNYALLFYALNLGIGVDQALRGVPDPMVLLLASMGVGAAAFLVVLSV